jgi:hypothetical protein
VVDPSCQLRLVLAPGVANMERRRRS